MQPRGGYKTVTVVQLCNALAAYDAGRIGLRAMRVYFAAFAAVAIREAAARARERARDRPHRVARYRFCELARHSGLTEGEVRRELGVLRRAGLVRHSEREIELERAAVDGGGELATQVTGRGRSPLRPVPVPRTLLIRLARSDRAAFSKTLMAYLIRGLSLDGRSGELRAAGSAKVRWIAEHFRLSERAVRYARRELIALGILGADPGSSQRKLNRDGAYFTLDVAWSDRPYRETTEAADAPLAVDAATRIAPPRRDGRTSCGIKNQEARGARAPGSCGGGEHLPSLRDIRRADLTRTSSVLMLYEQAVRSGWLQGSEARRRDFVAAAIRATRAKGDPVRIFVAIVRRGLWHHITAPEEQRAVAALKRFAVSCPGKRPPERSSRYNGRPDRSIAMIPGSDSSSPTRVGEITTRLISGLRAA